MYKKNQLNTWTWRNSKTEPVISLRIASSSSITLIFCLRNIRNLSVVFAFRAVPYICVGVLPMTQLYREVYKKWGTEILSQLRQILCLSLSKFTLSSKFAKDDGRCHHISKPYTPTRSTPKIFLDLLDIGLYRLLSYNFYSPNRFHCSYRF